MAGLYRSLFRNRLLQQDSSSRWRLAVFAVIGLGFGVSIYVIFYRALTYFTSVFLLGPLLVVRLLSMIFLTFLAMLLFSNIVASISIFYLSEDLHLLLSTPLRLRTVFACRFAESILNSSWMVAAVCIPIFLAYGVVLKAGALFYPAAILIFLPFILIPANIGMIFTLFLTRVFPARRTREIFLLLSVGVICILIVLFRFLQPEKLANPNELMLASQFILELKAPSAPYLPSYWATTAISDALRHRWSDYLSYTGILWACAAAGYIIAYCLAKKLFYPGWWSAQESSMPAAGPVKGTGLEKFFRWLPVVPRSVLIKDIKVFRRDPTQWPQVIVLFAIVLLYLANIYNIPSTVMAKNIYTSSLLSLIFFLNIGFAGFIITAVAARFIFPSVSLEGKAFWLIRCSGLSIEKFLKEKFLLNFVPILILAEGLVVLSTVFLRVDTFMLFVSVITVFFFSLGLTALGVGLGAVYPKFNAANPAEIATSWGAVFYMILGIMYVGIILILEAGPVRLYYLRKLNWHLPSYLWWVYLSAALFILINLAVVYIPLKSGVLSLKNQED